MGQQAFPNGLTDLESSVKDITQKPKPTEQLKPQKQQAPEEASVIRKAWQHFTFICTVEIVVKIKAIARIEGYEGCPLSAIRRISASDEGVV